MIHPHDFSWSFDHLPVISNCILAGNLRVAHPNAPPPPKEIRPYSGINEGTMMGFKNPLIGPCFFGGELPLDSHDVFFFFAEAHSKNGDFNGETTAVHLPR